MNKSRNLLIFLVAQFLFVACQKNDDMPHTMFGECSYYPSFLWSDADTCGVAKRLDLNFNDDAKGDTGCFAEISFVDKEGNPIPDNILEITIDGNVLKNNTFKVYSSKTFNTINFRFLPNAESGNHQGYIKLLSYKLDRFNEQELTGQPVEVMKWNLCFKNKWNPLEEIFIWIGITILICLFIWFVFLKPIKYPKFRAYKKTFLVNHNGQVIYNKSCQFRGARMVVFADKKESQSLLNRIFTGRIDFYTHPCFTQKIVFAPKKKGKYAFVRAVRYTITPNPIPSSGMAIIKGNNIEVNIK